jgi:Fur family transcriptional regulator, ferric uptake regulator
VAIPTQGELQELLQANGVRPTRQRLELIGELAREPNDVTAQTLWRRLRDERESKVGLATVYRTLALLRDHHVIDALNHRGGELCYRLCSDTHHHHLVCRSCHRVVEIDGCDLGSWIETLADAHGFTDTDHRLEVAGVCAECRGDARRSGP